MKIQALKEYSQRTACLSDGWAHGVGSLNTDQNRCNCFGEIILFLFQTLFFLSKPGAYISNNAAPLTVWWENKTLFSYAAVTFRTCTQTCMSQTDGLSLFGGRQIHRQNLKKLMPKTESFHQQWTL